MKITFEQAYAVLMNCSAVIWNDSYLSYPSLIENDDENPNEDVFLELECDLNEAKFIKGDNLEVTVEGMSLWLKNINGEEIQITPLMPNLITTPNPTEFVEDERGA